MPKTKVPALPEPSTVKDPHLRRVIGSIKEALEIRLGRRGDPMDQAVTFRDLQEAGMIKRKAGVKSGDNPVPFEPDTEGTVGEAIERISNEIENSWLFARLNQRIELLGFSIDDVRSFLGDTKARVETVVEQTEGQFENVASQITTVATQFDDKLSFVQNDITSLTSQYEAMASQVTLVAAVADSKNKVYRQSSQPGSANTGDVWIRSSDNRYFYFNGSQWIETGDNRIGQNSAAIQTEQTARATADAALANQITTVQATLNGQLASVQQDIDVTMDNVTGLRASYVLTTDVNGYVSGFGTYSDGKTSDFAVSADRFWIAPPNSWGKVKPFIVENGRVYIDEARIRKGSIDTLLLAGNAVTVPVSSKGAGVLGSGAAQIVAQVTMRMPDVGPYDTVDVLLLWSFNQGYQGAAKQWGYGLSTSSSYPPNLEQRGLTTQMMYATVDKPTGQFLANGYAGNSLVTFYLWWKGTDSTVSAEGTITAVAYAK